MNENVNAFLYILVLGLLFGLLYLMKFVVPHYEPKEYDEYATPTTYDPIPSQKDQEVSGNIDINEPKVESSNSTSSESSEAYFQELKTSYQTNVLNTLPPGKPRSDVIVRYYKHPPDGNSVYALKNLGFYIHERPIDQAMADYESNSIYYGDSVKQQDLLIVAYTLIKEGMPIKSIKPSMYHDGWKYNAIEIGADSTVIEKEALTVDQLLQLSF